MRFTMLRSSLLALCVFSVFALRATAQTDYSYRSATNFLTIGASFAGGAAIATQDPPTGSKIGPVFSFWTGVNAMYPISSVASVTLDLGYDNRGNKIRLENNTDVYTISNFHYFSMTPGIRLSSFWMGLNIGLPVGGTNTTKAGTGSSEVATDFTQLQKDSTALMVEGRLGVSVPIVDQLTWWLGLNFTVGYCFTKLGTNVERPGLYNPSLASAHLGLTLQFAIPKTGRKH